jgi:hypothetical protein
LPERRLSGRTTRRASAFAASRASWTKRVR